MLNLSISGYVYPLLGVLAILIGIKIFKLPPKLPKFKLRELATSNEYHNRLNRKGVHTPKNLAVVIKIGKAQEMPSWRKAYGIQREQRAENRSERNKIRDREPFTSMST